MAGNGIRLVILLICGSVAFAQTAISCPADTRSFHLPRGDGPESRRSSGVDPRRYGHHVCFGGRAGDDDHDTGECQPGCDGRIDRR